MSQDEIRKLIGGYATGTLTEAERKALFAAALDDQDLFDELAREQSLKELLDSPGARTRLTAALAPPEQKSPAIRFRLAIAGVLAASFAVALGIVLVIRKPQTADFAVVTKTEAQIAESRPAVAEPKGIQSTAIAVPSGAPAAPQPRGFQPPPGTQSTGKTIAPLPPPVLLQPPPEGGFNKEDSLKKTESARRDEPAKALTDEKDAAPQAKVQAAQDAQSVEVRPEPLQALNQTVQVQQAPSTLGRQQAAQAPKATPAPPPATAANSALAAGRIAGFASRTAPPKFAFDYSIRRDNLTVNPLAPGYLQVTAAMPGAQQVVLQQASREEAGTSVTIPIPARSLNLTIEFSAGPTVQQVAAALDDLKDNRFREKAVPTAISRTGTPISKDKAGHVEQTTFTPNPSLSITVAVPTE